MLCLCVSSIYCDDCIVVVFVDQYLWSMFAMDVERFACFRNSDVILFLLLFYIFLWVLSVVFFLRS